MEKYNLSDKEKKILRSLSVSQYEGDMFSDLSREELYVASSHLKGFGLIVVHYAEGNELVAARISDEGVVYLKENPMLENPIDENELKRLQIDKLEYEKRIRKQEDVIRFWKLLNAITGIIALLGWLLYLIKIG